LVKSQVKLPSGGRFVVKSETLTVSGEAELTEARGNGQVSTLQLFSWRYRYFLRLMFVSSRTCFCKIFHED